MLDSRVPADIYSVYSACIILQKEKAVPSTAFPTRLILPSSHRHASVELHDRCWSNQAGQHAMPSPDQNTDDISETSDSFFYISIYSGTGKGAIQDLRHQLSQTHAPNLSALFPWIDLRFEMDEPSLDPNRGFPP